LNYLVWSFDYYHDSAGQKTMHRLCHELNEAGQAAFVAYELRNPDWNTPYHPGPLTGDWTAIYPEIVAGNPWRAPRVVRYVLNHPGKLGGDKVYDPAENVFFFLPVFNDAGLQPERLLFLPTIELDIYRDRHLSRAGEVFYVGKGQQTRDLPGAVEITNDLKRDRHVLADTLNRATLLTCFDNMTAMIEIARLCGCPVRLVPNGDYTREQYDAMTDWQGIGWDEVPGPFDSGALRDRQLALYEAFRGQLADFIRITQ
jgi:hypothetical protein